MNKSFKKYRCHYKQTRFAVRLVNLIHTLRAARYGAVIAVGKAQLNAIASTGGDRLLKNKALADCYIKTKLAAIESADSIPYPKWYKKAPR